MATRLVIADDHTLFRKGLISILGKNEGIDVVGEAADGKEAFDVVDREVPNIVLLDLHMPKTNGFDLISKISKNHPDVKIIIISMYNSDSHIVQSIEAGACGYLDKNAEPEEILLAIQCTNEIGIYFNDRTNKAMIQNLVSRKNLKPFFKSGKVAFNKNEIEVVNCLAQEMTSNEISARLFLSPRTIESIKVTLLQKTGTRNSIGIVLYALKNEIIKL
jgi:DNA-binding NarL/FixJ family response regulator